MHGDTPKDPLDKSGWPDGTPNNANWIYVMGNGLIKTGWFGGVRANGTTDGFDPATGETIPNQQANATSAAAGAAVAFAVAKGDMKRVRIDPSLLKPEEAEIVEDLIVAATSDAKAKVEAQVQAKMAEVTGGLPLPPGMKLF